MPSGPPSGSVPKSPFFRPTQKSDYDPQLTTPGGSKHLRKRSKSEIEQKSTILGCSANLINAIVGSGIVGLPYAIQQAGLIAGIGLVILCAILTDKSLRLLIETAKHVHVPSYETVAEVAFGKFGFLFVALSMFIMAYGAMLSYLMIIKDTFSMVLGIESTNYPMKRAILFLISITIIVPLSSQRDMAALAKTSRINVTVDLIMVLLVLYCSPISENISNYKLTFIHWDTIFVGVGVLSFAFVCQHSGFIIAGSLDKPTKDRWASCTRNALSFCVILALMCGTGGYLGYQENTQGNILNSLDDSLPANIARGLLGTTMLFVYPMESFVARHVCVVLFFQGRSAHEGDDTSVLNRKDRRITLTLLLYLIAVIPAGIFQNLGTVLAACGAVGGSCLSYIGPGMVYLGIHGSRFLELSKSFFGDTSHTDQPFKFCGRGAINDDDDINDEDGNSSGTTANETSDEEESLLYNTKTESEPAHIENENFVITQMKNILWYIWLMPIWCKIASIGKSTLTIHVSELALKSPHPIRIGNVRFASTKIKGGSTRVIMLSNPSTPDSKKQRPSSVPIETTLIRRDSLPKDYVTTTTSAGGSSSISPSRMVDGNIVALPLTPNQRRLLPPTKMASLPLKQEEEERGGGGGLISGGTTTTATTTTNYQSINSQQVGRMMAKRKKQEEQLALEDDPQQVPPGIWDFLVAIFFIIFGVVAMVAGLFSIVQE